VQPPQDRFDATVLWLGQQLGQVEVEPEPVKPKGISKVILLTGGVLTEPPA
jgi:hypothetical protein